MDLIRNVLAKVEDSDGSIRDLEIEGHDESEVAYHVTLLDEAGLLISDILRSEVGAILMLKVERLTWEGHEFIASARNDTV